MSSPEESVAVVIVMFNSRPLLADLIDSLTTGLEGIEWQLVAADNASADGSAELLRELAPDARIVEMGRNAGYAAGINAAVAAAGPHTAILVLNPDVRLGSGCIKELLRALREPGTGIAVPMLLDRNGELILSMRRQPTILRAFADAFVGAERAGRHPRLGEMVTDPARYESECLTDWAEGSTQLISAECWSACGPWDESFFLYSEETDFDLRARDAGFSTRFAPSACAVHLEGDSAGSPGLWRLLVLNRVRLFRKRKGIPAAALFWVAVVVREGSRALLGKSTSRSAVKALFDPRALRETPGPHSVR